MRPAMPSHKNYRGIALGQRGWSDPETFTIAKEQIAVELRELARELGR